MRTETKRQEEEEEEGLEFHVSCPFSVELVVRKENQINMRSLDILLLSN